MTCPVCFKPITLLSSKREVVSVEIDTVWVRYHEVYWCDNCKVRLVDHTHPKQEKNYDRRR